MDVRGCLAEMSAPEAMIVACCKRISVVRLPGGNMNTAPLPVLPDISIPLGRRFDTSRSRGQALSDAGAIGYRYGYMFYDVVVGNTGIWIAQDDCLPEDPGDYDPVAAEWREVVTLAREFGYRDLGEPAYDTLLGVWVWFVARP